MTRAAVDLVGADTGEQCRGRTPRWRTRRPRPCRRAEPREAGRPEGGRVTGPAVHLMGADADGQHQRAGHAGEPDGGTVAAAFDALWHASREPAE